MVRPRTRRLTCTVQLVWFYYHYFLFFITNYNIQVLHDFDNRNKRRRRVWTVSDKCYSLGHVKQRVLGNWCVSVIITFLFPLLTTTFRYYMTTTMEISNAGGWIASDKWYDPGHIKQRVLGNWYVFIIITFYFSLLNIIFRL